MTKRKLIEHEARIDRQIQSCDCFNNSLQDFLIFYLIVIDRMIHNNQEGHVIWSLSYILANCLDYFLKVKVKFKTHTLSKFTFDPLPKDKHNYEACKDLISYANFCELMPEVRRDYYDVSGSDKHFSLSYPTDIFQKHEINDVIFLQLSLN